MASQPSFKPLLSTRRRRGAALQIIFGGLVLLLLPLFLGKSPVADGFSTLSPVGWFMLVGGVTLLWMLRDKAPPARTVEVAPASRYRPMPVVVDAPPFVNRMAIDIPLDFDGIEPSGSANDRTQLVRPQAWDKGLFEVMEWRRFETLVEVLFQQAGFETGLQSHGEQEGVDIWLYSRSQTGGPVSLVQCKHWYGERVNPDRLRPLRSALDARQLPRGQFATTATFTPEAVSFARENGIHLLDADGLLALIQKRTEAQQQALLEIALG